MCVAFDGCTTGKRSAPGDKPNGINAPLSAGSERFIAGLVHLMSLMHGLALQHLRGDEVLSNLTAARPRKDGGPQLPMKPPDNNGDATFDFGTEPEGSGGGGGGGDGGGGGGGGHGGGAKGGGRGGGEDGESASVGVVSVADDGSDLLDPERTCHYRLKGAHLIHTTDGDDTRDARWNAKKIFLLDGSSREWKECNRCMPLDVIGGVDPNEVAALTRLDCDRPYLVMSWIQSLIILRSETSEGLRVPPPILSRVHQVLSDGILGFNQAREGLKVARGSRAQPIAEKKTKAELV